MTISVPKMAYLGHRRSLRVFPGSLTVLWRRQGNLDIEANGHKIACMIRVRTLKNTYDVCTHPFFWDRIVTTFSSAIHRLWRTTAVNGRHITPIPRFLLHIGWNWERFLWLFSNWWYMRKINCARGWCDRRRKNLIYRRSFPCNCIARQTFSLCDRPKGYIYS